MYNSSIGVSCKEAEKKKVQIRPDITKDIVNLLIIVWFILAALEKNCMQMTMKNRYFSVVCDESKILMTI